MSKDAGDQKTKTTTTSEPWSGVQPYLTGAYGQAQALYNRGAPGYYPGQTVAPMSSYTKNSLDATAQRAAYGSDMVRTAQGQLTSTMNGDYLNAGNPYFQGAVNAATRPMINAFNDQVMPGLDSNFSSAGRYGSGAHALASSDAGAQLTDQIGDVSSQMAYQNYGDERQRQIQAQMFAPQLAREDYNDLAMLGAAGQGYDQYNQGLINANIDRFNYNNNAQWNFLNDYIGLLNGAVGGSSTTTGTQPSSSSPITGAVGGALAGAGTGSTFGPMGTAAGAIIGGIGGLLGNGVY